MQSEINTFTPPQYGKVLEANIFRDHLIDFAAWLLKERSAYAVAFCRAPDLRSAEELTDKYLDERN